MQISGQVMWGKNWMSPAKWMILSQWKDAMETYLGVVSDEYPIQYRGARFICLC